ncbi:MAG TPA: hypothetical protein VI358_18080 [Pseudolabrys sp.]
MANSNSPFGARHLGMATGASPATFSLITRKIASNNSHAIGTNDLVVNLDTGYVDYWTPSSSVVSNFAGIFNGCKFFSTALQRVIWSPYWPGSGATGDVTAFIVPVDQASPSSFVIQATSTPFTFADIGAVCDIDRGTVNTTTGISGATLDRGTIGTAATLPFKIMNVWSAIGAPGSLGTDDTANYNWVLVSANSEKSTGLN